MIIPNPLAAHTLRLVEANGTRIVFQTPTSLQHLPSRKPKGRAHELTVRRGGTAAITDH